MYKTTCIIFLLFFQFIYGEEASINNSTDNETIQTAIEEMKSRDLIRFINEMKRIELTMQNYAFIEKLWYDFLTETNTIRRKYRPTDELYVELADLITQAHFRGYHEVNITDFHNYMRDRSLNGSPLGQMKAIASLHFYNDKNDVKLLKIIIQKQDSDTFNAAVFSLVNMCGIELDNVISSLMDTIDENNFQYLLSTRDKYSKILSRRCKKFQGSESKSTK